MTKVSEHTGYSSIADFKSGGSSSSSVSGSSSSFTSNLIGSGIQASKIGTNTSKGGSSLQGSGSSKK